MARRQLSAIMFTDLAGYTAMMQEDEFNAIGLRDRHRTILEEEIRKNNGQILQYYGDGALSLFNSTIDATVSAISIQSLSRNGDIPLRIGIHTGDVVVDENGAYGDGVNIASRIESFSVPGSVMISDKVFDDLKNHQEFSPVLMGEFELKNVKRPVEVYALTNANLVVPARTDLKGKVRERIKSIAVLPFINRSSDPENEYFSDGVTEEIISALARIDRLRVISRTSSFAFKGKQCDAREIGRKLEVQSVLNGSVRKSGNRIRVTVELSSTFDGYQIWTETYDRMLEDVFEVQDEISLKIAQQLMEKLGTSGLSENEKSKSVNLDAYNHYLKGLFHFNKWTPGEAEIAVGYFEKALGIEPNYGLALSGLAQAYTLMSVTGYIKPSEGNEMVQEVARKAFENGEDLEQIYLALANIEFFYNWDFIKGKEYADKALELNPKSPDANLSRSIFGLVAGNVDAMSVSIEKALEIDPLSTIAIRTYADLHYLKGDYDRAIELYKQILEINPEYQTAYEFQAWALMMKGEVNGAIALFERGGDENEQIHSMKSYVQLGYAYGLKGEFDRTNEFLDKLKLEAEQDPDGNHDLSFATLYTVLGEKDLAFDHIRKCMDRRIGAILLLHISPVWKPLRDDPRYGELVKEIGLGEDVFG